MLRILNLPVRIVWEKFKPDTSMFVPCLDTKPVAQFIKEEAARRGYKVICKQVVERQRYGLRVWRIE